VAELNEAGFSNIKIEALGDMITGFLVDEGEVDEVSVDGNSVFSTDSKYAPDTEIIISYHSFPEEEQSTSSSESQPTSISEEESSKTEESGVVVTAAEEALESEFPKENARRAIMVALANGYSSGVFAEDGNTYDPSKFFSYSDVSGDFVIMLQDGTWSSKDEKTWHVENLELEDNYYNLITASCDIEFDGENYILSNLSGPFGGNSDISELEYDEAPYLTVPQDLISEDRNQAEVEEKDHRDDLDKYVAQAAFEQFGKELYPYGFECHWILGLTAESQGYDGSWFFKVEVTIKNQFGVELKTIAEGTVTGTTASCVVEDFLVDA
jgi:hypothetical protein